MARWRGRRAELLYAPIGRRDDETDERIAELERKIVRLGGLVEQLIGVTVELHGEAAVRAALEAVSC
jgi:hypothetical protein